MAVIEEEEAENADVHILPHDSSSRTVMYGTPEDFENMSAEPLVIFDRLLATAKAHHDAALTLRKALVVQHMVLALTLHCPGFLESSTCYRIKCQR